MMANCDFPPKESDGIDYKDVEVGEQDIEKIDSVIQKMIDRAVKKLPHDLRPTLHDMVMRIKDIFRIRLGKRSPVSVPPMVIELEGSERPIKVRQRRYSPWQLALF